MIGGFQTHHFVIAPSPLQVYVVTQPSYFQYSAIVSNAAAREQNLELCPETPYTVLCAHDRVFVKHMYMHT